MAKILVVEDEPDLAGPIRDWLSTENHLVEIVDNGNLAVDYLRVNKYDLIVLDLMLPGMGGMDVCRWFREHAGTTAILMLTAKGSIEDKEAGLDAGADDYLTKPFHLKELAARIRALLRRPAQVSRRSYQIGDLEIDTAKRLVRKQDREVHLLPKEYSLLEFLVRHAGQIFSAEALLERVWASDSSAMPETVRTNIKTLRKKIDTAGRASIISTVHGIGYKIEAS
jgi:DNA-binding response OmpR family regulator